MTRKRGRNYVFSFLSTKNGGYILYIDERKLPSSLLTKLGKFDIIIFVLAEWYPVFLFETASLLQEEFLFAKGIFCFYTGNLRMIGSACSE